MSLYGRLYRRGLWPFYEKTRGRTTCRLLAEAERTQWRAPGEVRQQQWDELKRLLKHAYEQSPWHRARFDRHRLQPERIDSLADFQNLPSMNKDDVRQHRDEMLARDYQGQVYEHRTGGSTGTPLQFYVNRNSYEWRLAVSMRGYGWAGCEDGDRQFYVWGAPIGVPTLKQRVKTRLHHAFLRRKLFSSFNFSEAAMAECARQINMLRAPTLVGYTNALVLLARYLEESNQEIHAPRAIITAAEGVNSLDRELLERVFRAPVFVSYGSREFMLIAMECEQHRGMHISADNLLVEVVGEDRASTTGEVGKILITDLHNFGMPFIRYEIGDLGVSPARLCPCGRGLPLLERIEGRLLDAIRTPDGKIVPGEFFPHLMKEFDAVQQFQVVQKTLDALEIKLVLRDEGHTTQFQRMEREIKRVLGHSIIINFNRVDKIPLTASGKFRVTVSNVPSSSYATTETSG